MDTCRTVSKGFDLEDYKRATKYYLPVARLDDMLKGMGEAVDHARERLELLGVECPPLFRYDEEEALSSMPDRDRHLKLARRSLSTLSGNISDETRAEQRAITITHLKQADDISPLSQKERRILQALEASED